MLVFPSGKLVQHQLGEMGLVWRGPCGGHPRIHDASCSGLVVFDDAGGHFAQDLAIAQTKDVGQHQVLLDRSVPLA